MFRALITVYPDVPPRMVEGRLVGGFPDHAFADLLQRHVHIPGLDQAWHHTLINVTVASDRASATLTVQSEPVAAVRVDQHLRVVQGVPPAWVRVHDQSGQVLAEAALSAPLQPGQTVEVGGVVHHVSADPHWPGRHPDTGMCVGDKDWQHVTVTPAPPEPVVVAAD